MATSAKLGGFKILKDINCFSLVHTTKDKLFPAKFFRSVAWEKINLPYMTCIPDGSTWRLSFAVDAADAAKTLNLIEHTTGSVITQKFKSAILSIFPHKGDPCISALFLEALGKHGLEPEALTSSPSAISAVLKRELLPIASKSLFGPFSFSAYRTPHDWKLAQKGREILFKEVVATYQESRPKVYGLRYREKQELLSIKFSQGNIGQFGFVLKEFGESGSYLSFLGTCPRREKGSGTIIFCLSRTLDRSHKAVIRQIAPQMHVENLFPVATFSMTGPHFGDRYGIVSELLTSFERAGVDLLALNCSIASIKGIVPSEQIQIAINTIQGCFEVPALMKKG